MDPVVEGALVVMATAPGESGLAEMLADQRQIAFGVYPRHPVEIDADQIHQPRTLIGRQARRDNALGWQDQIVGPRAREMPAVPGSGQLDRKSTRLNSSHV